MALMKEAATSYGDSIKATYNRVKGIKVDYDARKVYPTILGYADEAARRAGADHLGVGAVELSLADIGPEPDRPAIYAAIKALPGWAGATDC